MTASPQSTEVNTPVQLAATVDCPADPTGGLGVTFFDGGDLLDTVPVNANGQAGYTATFTTTGAHTITAAYNGNADCDASNNTTTVQVTAAPTPPAPTPGMCFLACGGLIGFTMGDVTNNVNSTPTRSTPRASGISARACFESPAWPATPGTHARRVVGVAQVRPVRGRSSALRSHAPDAAGPALRADGATFETRPSPGLP
ncbi:Ig-like domain-containing protein [Streptomyces halstedii]|uniref:Ig-like domain-containing protein n=1 Tax=Streptomyces halstedii TaxID=1944 RepID=UPI0038068B4F